MNIVGWTWIADNSTYDPRQYANNVYQYGSAAVPEPTIRLNDLISDSWWPVQLPEPPRVSPPGDRAIRIREED